ncbi:MFS transporter, partial [Planctomycetota bacterium]
MVTSTRALTLGSYMSMLFLGVGITLIGAAARNLGLTASEIGLLLAAQHLGFMISVAVSGALADVVDKPRLLACGSVILGSSFLAFYATELLLLNVIVMALNGIGIGVYEGATDAMLLDLHEDNPGRYITINHFAVTIGMVAITLYLAVLDVSWRSSVIQSGIAVLLLGGMFACSRQERRR